MSFADYIVYADESGSPTLERPDPDYPIFVLALVIIEKSVYCDKVVPAIQRLKFDFFGHDQIILHERDIRRQTGAFSVLETSEQLRRDFLSRVSAMISAARVEVVCSVVRKIELVRRYSNPWSPYNIALGFCLERLGGYLLERDQYGLETTVIFEARGQKEDKELELQFRRITSGQDLLVGHNVDFACTKLSPRFSDKRSNSSGLQLADLFARPIGLKVLRNAQINHAYNIIEPKLINGEIKCFP